MTVVRGIAGGRHDRRRWNWLRGSCLALIAVGAGIANAAEPLRDFDLTDPAVEAKMRERYGSRVPLDEPVISPGAMFDSPLLVSVPTG